MKTRLTKYQVATLLSRVWLRSLLGVLLAIVMAMPLVDWAQMHFEFLRYHPTITVDQPARVVSPMTVFNEAGASPATRASSSR